VKAESTVMPVAPYEIEYEDDMARITFFENVEWVETEDGGEDEASKYRYDMYRLAVRNREDLIYGIENSIEAWVQMAKDTEYADLACVIRQKRDQLLKDTDWTQVVDVALTAEEKEVWRVYRQALRDAPQQEGFPYDVVWPALNI